MPGPIRNKDICHFKFDIDKQSRHVMMTKVHIIERSSKMTHMDDTKQSQLAGAVTCFMIAGAILAALTSTPPPLAQTTYQRDADVAEVSAVVAMLGKRR